MLRFTIRDVLWLTAVAALGVAWCVDRSILGTKLGRLAADNLKQSLDLEKERERSEEAWRILGHMPSKSPPPGN